MVAFTAILSWLIFYYNIYISEQIDLIALAGCSLIFTSFFLLIIKWDENKH
tara:strand:- start:206 stop:358 length:153 start_codon:yes stop_codon:yes gene_type:complete